MRSLCLLAFAAALASCKGTKSYEVTVSTDPNVEFKQSAIGVWVLLCDADYPAPVEDLKHKSDIEVWFASDPDGKRKLLEQAGRAHWVNLQVKPRGDQPQTVELTNPKGLEKTAIFVVANFATSSQPEKHFLRIDPSIAKKGKVEIVLQPGEVGLKPSEK